jgi:hypothetical protein
MQADFDALFARGVRVLCVFTPGVPENYNHRSQFRRQFPRVAAHPQFAFEYFADSDHTFSRRGPRARITELIRAWVLRNGAGTAAVTAAVTAAGTAALVTLNGTPLAFG